MLAAVTAKLFVTFLAALLAAAPACTRAPEPAPVSQTPDIPTLEFEKYSLPNGLEVILSEDHRLPLVAVNLWYHVGPANEEPGRTGFAHLFEHMMFQGSANVPRGEHFKLVTSHGGQHSTQVLGAWCGRPRT